MAEVLAGEKFVFQVLWTDEQNIPIANVENPKITIFSFSSSGVKQVLVNEAAMPSADPAEVGRYTYVYTIPTTMGDGQTVYAEMTGTSAGLRLLVDTQVSVITSGRFQGGGGSGGLAARFVKTG